MYNSTEVKINLKKAKNGEYFIGNCDMEINIADTVIKFYPPKDGEWYGALVINNYKEKPMAAENSKSGVVDEDT